MKFLCEVPVCSLDFRLYFATEKEVPSLITNEAYTDLDACRIYLRHSLRKVPTRLADAVVHELSHAIWDASGLGYWFRETIRAHFKLTAKEADRFEELFIRLHTPALITTLRGAGLLARGIRS